MVTARLEASSLFCTLVTVSYKGKVDSDLRRKEEDLNGV